jgi:hypothetical protein
MPALPSPLWRNKSVSMRSDCGRYVAAEDKGHRLVANRQQVDAWERFVAEPHPQGVGIALRSHWG